jgi:hypothetical protein
MIFESYICQDFLICDNPFGVMSDLECIQIYIKISEFISRCISMNITIVIKI